VQPISTTNAPTPAGHYSQGMSHAGLVFVAGQLPLDPKTGEVIGPNDITAQTEQVLRNVEAVLKAGGSSLDRLLSVTVYITGHALWGDVNKVYARMLGAHRPARAVVPVPDLRTGCMIEVQAVGATSA
jgi:2-iminobutanoate/2-iminopropanoate deaminase